MSNMFNQCNICDGLLSEAHAGSVIGMACAVSAPHISPGWFVSTPRVMMNTEANTNLPTAALIFMQTIWGGN